MEQKIVKNTFFKFFFPALASSLMLSVISMTDLMIAGNFVGETALTTISLALPVIIYVQIITALYGMGGAIVLSTSMGEGKREECNRIFTISTVSTLVISIVSLVLGLLFLLFIIKISIPSSRIHLLILELIPFLHRNFNMWRPVSHAFSCDGNLFAKRQ